MNQRLSARERAEALEEQQARERGRSLPHYAKKAAKELSSPPRRGRFTPSKRDS